VGKRAAMNSIIGSDFTARLPTIFPFQNKNRVKNKSRNVFRFNTPVLDSTI